MKKSLLEQPKKVLKMSNYELNLKLKDKSINVLIEEKHIKNLRLKVSPSCEVKMSIPNGVKKDEIEKFLSSKKRWLERNINIFESLKPYENKAYITNGGSVKILGREHNIWIKPAKEDKIEVADLKLYIYSQNHEDKEKLKKQYESFYKKEALKFFQERLDFLYPIIKKHKIKKPAIKIRKMKTRWGSCNKSKQYITLNYNLFKTPKSCIDYVILHELAHFIYPQHNKLFYDFVSIHMPDWKDRKKQLDYEMSKMIL